MTLALPEVLAPYPIPAYPARPLRPTLECIVEYGGSSVPLRYTINRRGEVFIAAMKVNLTWVDPIVFGLSDAAIRVLENECRELEAELRECE